MNDWSDRIAAAFENKENFTSFCDQVYSFIAPSDTSDRIEMEKRYSEVEKSMTKAFTKLYAENFPEDSGTSRELLEAMLFTLFLMCILYEHGKMYADILVNLYRLCETFCIAYEAVQEKNKENEVPEEKESMIFSCMKMDGDVLQEYASDLNPHDEDPLSYLSSNLVTRVIEKCINTINLDKLEKSDGNYFALIVGYYVVSIAYINDIVSGKFMKNMCEAFSLYGEMVNKA